MKVSVKDINNSNCENFKSNWQDLEIEIFQLMYLPVISEKQLIKISRDA